MSMKPILYSRFRLVINPLYQRIYPKKTSQEFLNLHQISKLKTSPPPLAEARRKLLYYKKTESQNPKVSKFAFSGVGLLVKKFKSYGIIVSGICALDYWSHLMTKPTKWMCAQRRLRSAWAHMSFVGFVMRRLILLFLENRKSIP